MLSQEQAELVQLIQELEPEKVHQVLEFTRKVKAEPPIDYSDEWTEEDLRDFAAASWEYAEKTVPWDESLPEEGEGAQDALNRCDLPTESPSEGGK